MEVDVLVKCWFLDRECPNDLEPISNCVSDTKEWCNQCLLLAEVLASKQRNGNVKRANNGAMKVLNLGLDLPRFYFPSAEVVNVDIWRPYLLGWEGHRVLADVRFLPFKPKSFDFVVSIDMLEHLPKKDGKKVVGEMEKIARKAVLFTTPWFFYTQGEMDGNPNQKHLSVYSQHDFPNYEFMIVPFAGLYFRAVENA